MTDPSLVPEALRLSIPEFARREQIHVSTAWRWVLHGIKSHKLRAVRVGGRRFIYEADWEAFSHALNPDQSEPLATKTARADRAGTELDRRLGDDGSLRGITNMSRRFFTRSMTGLHEARGG